MLQFDAFSDIAFNPERSINCQAYSAALYVSLSRRGLLSADVLKDQEAYLDIIGRAKIDNAPIVFVGYGVNAPERGWDDFKGVDLHGKIALFLVNDPDFEAAPGEPAAGKFGGKAMTYYGRWTYKYEEAARRGAIGALIIHETAAAPMGTKNFALR